MVMLPKLDRWIYHGNVLVGYLYDYRQLPNGTRVKTDAVRFIDPTNLYAECLDGRYKLGTPGTAEEHNQPLIGKSKDSSDGVKEIKTGMFLNPNG